MADCKEVHAIEVLKLHNEPTHDVVARSVAELIDMGVHPAEIRTALANNLVNLCATSSKAGAGSAMCDVGIAVNLNAHQPERSKG